MSYSTSTNYYYLLKTINSMREGRQRLLNALFYIGNALKLAEKRPEERSGGEQVRGYK